MTYNSLSCCPFAVTRMVLNEFLFPQEEIKYQSPHQFQHGGQDYVLYITNRRIIGHKLKGFLFKKDRIFSVALQEIVNLDYKEKGVVHKKGILTIETETKKEIFEGAAQDVKVLLREMQTHLGRNEGLGAGSSGIGSADEDDDPLKVLKIRLAKGEISREEYSRLADLMKS